jgi:hypothetical protein
MFNGHGQNYFVDAIAFGLSTLPVCFVFVLIVAAMLEERSRVRGRRRRSNGKRGVRCVPGYHKPATPPLRRSSLR